MFTSTPLAHWLLHFELRVTFSILARLPVFLFLLFFLFWPINRTFIYLSLRSHASRFHLISLTLPWPCIHQYGEESCTDAASFPTLLAIPALVPPQLCLSTHHWDRPGLPAGYRTERPAPGGTLNLILISWLRRGITPNSRAVRPPAATRNEN